MMRSASLRPSTRAFRRARPWRRLDLGDVGDAVLDGARSTGLRPRRLALAWQVHEGGLASLCAFVRERQRLGVAGEPGLPSWGQLPSCVELCASVAHAVTDLVGAPGVGEQGADLGALFGCGVHGPTLSA